MLLRQFYTVASSWTRIPMKKMQLVWWHSAICVFIVHPHTTWCSQQCFFFTKLFYASYNVIPVIYLILRKLSMLIDTIWLNFYRFTKKKLHRASLKNMFTKLIENWTYLLNLSQRNYDSPTFYSVSLSEWNFLFH